VRTAIYETMSAAHRSGAHRRAAGLLADRGADPEQIASHLLLIPPAGERFVVAVMRSAADRALSRGGAQEAAAYLRRALAEPPDAADRAATLAELGVIEQAVDMPAAIQHLREAVSLTEERGRLAAVAHECGRALGQCNMNAEAIEMLRIAIDRAAEDYPDLREQATADLINASWTDPEFLPIAKELLAGVRDEELFGGPGSDMLHATLAHIEVRNAVDRARAGALARRAFASGSLEHQPSQHMYLALDALRAAGEHEAALAVYARGLAAARERGDLLNTAGLLSFRGWLLLDRGDLRAAEADVREGLEFSRVAGGLTHIVYSTVFVIDFLLERGDIEEAEPLLAGLGLEGRLPVNFHFLALLNARGRLRLAQRRLAEALTDFEAMREIDEALEMSATALWPWRTSVATALHGLGREDEARMLAAEETEVAARWGDPRRSGIALKILGLLLGGAAGERRLREAVEVLAESPARLEHAKALIELGAALRRRNERSKARQVLREGVELAQQCDAPGVAERGNEELAATGARPRAQLLTGLDSLTASERRVAQLAAEELSNKEIAQQLFVTVKTVEVHLSHVYRKLDIGSRRQLGRALAGSHAQPVAMG
jgi:DNA-binding CsgD family transcriptional regulator